MDFTKADAETLGAKLQALDLTDGERALLIAVVDAANDEEVEGHAFSFASMLGSFAVRVNAGTMKSAVQKKKDDLDKGQIDKIG